MTSFGRTNPQRARITAWFALHILAAGAATYPSAPLASARDGSCNVLPFLTHVAPGSGKRTPVFRRAGSRAIFYRSGMAIDADGAPNAYHPADIGIDALVHGGRPGDWWALVTENGEPIVQRRGEFKGFYVSMTWLHREDGMYRPEDPEYWVDARHVPYLAIPKSVFDPAGVDKGDLAFVFNEHTGASSFAIVADWGTEETLGEGSIALAERLGVPPDPRIGGVPDRIVYIVFPNSGARPRWPRPEPEMADKARQLLTEFGGPGLLNACLSAPGKR
jgi:hypothetical protein